MSYRPTLPRRGHHVGRGHHVEAITSATLPAGRGHVYIAGEVQVVAAVQRAALAHGLEPDQVFAKAYWGRGKANADRGEPD